MKGNNELSLNQATIVEALQEYLDKRYTPRVKVVSIGLPENKYTTDVLVVKVEEAAEPSAQPADDGVGECEKCAHLRGGKKQWIGWHPCWHEEKKT